MSSAKQRQNSPARTLNVKLYRHPTRSFPSALQEIFNWCTDKHMDEIKIWEPQEAEIISKEALQMKESPQNLQTSFQCHFDQRVLRGNRSWTSRRVRKRGFSAPLKGNIQIFYQKLAGKKLIEIYLNKTCVRNKANCVIYSSPQAQQTHNKKRFAICENAGDKEKKN